ncbi:hypothetical protein C5B96_03445 [Subtercola sp. Z020]|nr:hypothetical protein C5B96_03445 [Subtercola sp. Z020]
MQLYSARRAQRHRQIAADVVALVLIGASVAAGIAVGALIGTLAALGRGIESAGSGFQNTMADAAGTLGGIPLIGAGASSPFASASSAGQTLAEAGRQQQEFVGNVALGTGLVVAALPIALVLLVWLRPRLAFVRRASLVRGLSASPAGTELLALRALVGQPPRELVALAADPVAAWRRGDPATIRSLAALELQSSGVPGRFLRLDEAPTA